MTGGVYEVDRSRAADSFAEDRGRDLGRGGRDVRYRLCSARVLAPGCSRSGPAPTSSGVRPACRRARRPQRLHDRRRCGWPSGRAPRRFADCRPGRGIDGVWWSGRVGPPDVRVLGSSCAPSAAGLVGGVFFAFSTLVMKGLVRLPPGAGCRRHAVESTWPRLTLRPVVSRAVRDGGGGDPALRRVPRPARGEGGRPGCWWRRVALPGGDRTDHRLPRASATPPLAALRPDGPDVRRRSGRLRVRLDGLEPRARTARPLPPPHSGLGLRAG